MERKPSFFPEFKGFVSGVVGAWCGVIVGQPFDIVKVRLQNSGGSAWVTLKTLLQNEGFFALWKGSLPPLIGLGLGNSISFGINENAKRIISSHNKPGEILSLNQHATCGIIAGFSRAFITCPVENVRIRIQIQGRIDPRGDPIYKGSVDCFLTILKNHGIVGLYKGFYMTMMRELIGMTMLFTIFQWSGRNIFGTTNVTTKELSVWKIMVCGGVAGYAYWIGFPFDVLKSKIQSDSYANPKYKNLRECVRLTYKEFGMAGYFKGFVPCILRAFPVNAAVLTGFEVTMSLFGRTYK
ncbi:unnamed protein product [Blepharisma stoltei]|uniref:Mitochondrial carrier protein n=1 Tax=Blepharisma stoltei TaxID=1481888 RepID=A0AAU9JGA5_9CILI|nr:unnamed protein product [Blepharisma stoltei]